MSIRLMTMVWERSPYKDGALLLHLALADFASDEGYCWPAVPTLARKIRRSPRHVSRLISQMVEDNTLQRVERPGTSNVYIVTPQITWKKPLTPMTGGDDTHDTPPLTPMSSDPSLNHHDPVSAHSRARPLPEEDLEDLEDLQYVDLDEVEETTRPKYTRPETDEQKGFLNVCKAKWFKSGQKSKVKALLKSFTAGDLLGDRVYSECALRIENMEELDTANLPPLPRSWYTWRISQAKSHSWSVDGFINALLNRDQLMRHCQIKMGELGITAGAGKVENGVYVIELPEGGPR